MRRWYVCCSKPYTLTERVRGSCSGGGGGPCGAALRTALRTRLLTTSPCQHPTAHYVDYTTPGECHHIQALESTIYRSVYEIGSFDVTIRTLVTTKIFGCLYVELSVRAPDYKE